MSERAREFVDEAAPKLDLEIDYAPMPQQLKFHKALETHELALYAGGYGSGKTIAGCQQAIAMSLEYPNNAGLIGRNNYPELRDTTMATFFKEILKYEMVLGSAIGDRGHGESRGIPGYNEKDNTYKFTNGSLVYFRYFEGRYQEGEHLKSLNLGWFYIDEGTDTREAIFKQLLGRLRLNNVKRRCGWITTNTSGKGNWVYQNFYGDKASKNRAVIETTTYDNIHLPQDYIERLEDGFDTEEIERYLYGQWGAFRGQIYKSFNRVEMVVDLSHADTDKDFGSKITVVDVGITNPTAILTLAYNGEKVRIWDEFYKRGSDSEMLIDEVIRRGQLVIIDPSAKDIIVRMKRKGVRVYPGNNNVQDGILIVKQYCKPGKLEIDVGCVETIREFESYKYRVVKGETIDQPQKRDDHSMDAIRYGMMYFDKPKKAWVGK